MDKKRDNFHHLKVISKETGFAVVLDERELYGVEKYKVESICSGKAKLTLEIVVKHP